jgi:hypothetical protein
MHHGVVSGGTDYVQMASREGANKSAAARAPH